MGLVWWIVLSVAAFLLVFVIAPSANHITNFISKSLKKNNSLFFSALLSILLFFALVIVFLILIYQICDLMKADDFLKDLMRSSLPVLCAFVSAVFIFVSESDREDIYKRKSVQPYLYIEDYETSSYCCESLKLKNTGSGSACNIVLDFRSIKYNDLQQKCIRAGESDEIKNIKLYKGDNQTAEIIYKDVYDNKYQQEIKFNVENNVITPTLSSPEYVPEKKSWRKRKKSKNITSDK